MAARIDRLLDAVIVLLATWTVVYHAALLLGLPSNLALGSEALLLAGLSVVEVRRPGHRSVVEVRGAPATSLQTTSVHVVVVIAAALAAIAMALDAPWVLVWVSWLV
ncbi:MAG: hypothetical protein ABIO16_14770, partial [Nocardioides sp.]